MPMGKGLKENIASKLGAQDDELWQSLTPLLELTKQGEAATYKELKKFIASNMSRAESIDNFLHTHSENPKLVAIAKLPLLPVFLMPNAAAV